MIGANERSGVYPAGGAVSAEQSERLIREMQMPDDGERVLSLTLRGVELQIVDGYPHALMLRWPQ